MKTSLPQSEETEPDDDGGIVRGEPKSMMFHGYEYMFRVDVGPYLDIHHITVVGGKNKIRATTTCREKDVKVKIMRLMKSLLH